MEDFNFYLNRIGEIGFVKKVIPPIVYVEGLPGATPDEVVMSESGEISIVTAIREDAVELLSFSKTPLKVGTRLARSAARFEISLGPELLGSIIDPLGHSLDPSHPLPLRGERRPVDTIPPGIQSRTRIRRPCETGVTTIDLMVPLGKGQRELVIGDQKTGKSRFLLRSVLTQVRQGAVGVYAAIGKPQITVKQIEEFLREAKISEKTVLVVSESDDPVSLVYLTPYVAMTIAEYFRDAGNDVLLVLDDLSLHAKAYREISLLGRRYPGRNSYPGDIFYAHARLLERAGNFKHARGERAITCLPVVETVEGDLTGYIQTNLMSMTDGHLFFDHRLFVEGRRPAVDPFLSVTRVGHQVQSALKLEIGRTLVSFLREANALHNFASFGAELGEHVRKILAKEERIMQFLDQTVYDSLASNLQLLLFGLAWGNAWENKSSKEVHLAIQKIVFMHETNREFRNRVEQAIGSANNMVSLLERVKDLDASVSSVRNNQ